jgi:hypothetical protein
MGLFDLFKKKKTTGPTWEEYSNIPSPTTDTTPSPEKKISYADIYDKMYATSPIGITTTNTARYHEGISVTESIQTSEDIIDNLDYTELNTLLTEDNFDDSHHWDLDQQPPVEDNDSPNEGSGTSGDWEMVTEGVEPLYGTQTFSSGQPSEYTTTDSFSATTDNVSIDTSWNNDN